MKRRIFNAAAAICLVLSLGVVTFWVRSYSWLDAIWSRSAGRRATRPLSL